MTYDHFIKTRAISGNNFIWYIDEFYPDKPYIGCEGGFIVTGFTHYICPKAESITDVGTNSLACYIGSITNETSAHEYGKLDVNWNNTRVPFLGVKLSSLAPIRRNSLKLDWAYPNTLAPNILAIGLNFNNGNSEKTISVTADSWCLIGYVLGTGQKCEVQITTAGDSIVADFDLYTKSYVCRSERHTQLLASQSNTLKLGIGAGVNSGIGNVNWFPIYIKNTTSANINVTVSGQAPFIYNYGVVADDNAIIAKEYTFNDLT
jgi:hypothetical protein